MLTISGRRPRDLRPWLRLRRPSWLAQAADQVFTQLTARRSVDSGVNGFV